MSYHKVVSLPVGKIQFYGSVRGADEAGHYAFTITLVDRPAAYGEWVPLYPETGGDTRVEIVRFGYGSINNIDNPSPGARRKYLEQEVPLIRTLIEALFSDDEIRKQTFPFTGPGIKYLGPIVYRPGWIITESIAELGRPF